jgi:hypothetical protein
LVGYFYRDKRIGCLCGCHFGLNESQDLLLSFGMDDVITKPFVPENFMLLSPST